MSKAGLNCNHNIQQRASESNWLEHKLASVAMKGGGAHRAGPDSRNNHRLTSFAFALVVCGPRVRSVCLRFGMEKYHEKHDDNQADGAVGFELLCLLLVCGLLLNY